MGFYFVTIQVTYRTGLRGAEADFASLASEPSAPRKPLHDLYSYFIFCQKGRMSREQVFQNNLTDYRTGSPITTNSVAIQLGPATSGMLTNAHALSAVTATTS